MSMINQKMGDLVTKKMLDETRDELNEEILHRYENLKREIDKFKNMEFFIEDNKDNIKRLW